MGWWDKQNKVQDGFQWWQQAAEMGGQTSELGRQGKAVLDDNSTGILHEFAGPAAAFAALTLTEQLSTVPCGKPAHTILLLIWTG